MIREVPITPPTNHIRTFHISTPEEPFFLGLSGVLLAAKIAIATVFARWCHSGSQSAQRDSASDESL